MKVKFLPTNVELEVKPYQTVMDLAHKNGIKIKSVCNGMPSCAECRIRLVEGEANVLPPSVKELSLIGTGHFIDQRRLSCQLVCFGDVVVDLSEQLEKAESDTHRKPQGNLRKEQVAISNAVTGNLIEQDEGIKQFTSQFRDLEAAETEESIDSRPLPQSQQNNQNQDRQSRSENQGQRSDQRRGGRRDQRGNNRRGQQNAGGRSQPNQNQANSDGNGPKPLGSRRPFKYRPQ